MQNELFFANLLIQQTRDIIFCSDVNSQLLYVNDAACNLLKYTREELLSMTLQELDMDFCHKVWSKQWSQLQKQGNLTLESQYRTKTGEIIAVEVLITLTTYQNQVIGCFFPKIKIESNLDHQALSSQSDIELQNSSIKLLPAQNHTCGIIAVSSQGEILGVNRKFRELWSIQDTQMIGKNCNHYQKDFETQLKQPQDYNNLTWQRQGNDQEEQSSLIKLKDGRILAQNFVTQQSNGQVIGRICSIWEVAETVNRQPSNPLNRNGADFKEQFLSMFCHQLRSSLNIISFSNSLLKRRLLEEIKSNQESDSVQKSRSYFNNIQVEVEEINQLLDQLVFYSKLSIGKVTFQPTAIDLNWFCREIVSRMQTIALNKQQPINLINGDRCQSAYLDPMLLQTVLTNLLSNAIRYSPENSKIDFTIRSSQPQVIFEIKDSGIGIAKEDCQLIFEPFYRGSNVGEVQGSGIGLAIVKNLVELQHGTIEFTTEVGVGTTFIVSLPSVQPSNFN